MKTKAKGKTWVRGVRGTVGSRSLRFTFLFAIPFSQNRARFTAFWLTAITSLYVHGCVMFGHSGRVDCICALHNRRSYLLLITISSDFFASGNTSTSPVDCPPSGVHSSYAEAGSIQLVGAYSLHRFTEFCGFISVMFKKPAFSCLVVKTWMSVICFSLMFFYLCNDASSDGWMNDRAQFTYRCSS